MSFGIALCLIVTHTSRAANPHDMQFRARLLKAPHVYHMGEPIEVEISYSSQAEKKYYGSFGGPIPEDTAVVPHITPMEGVVYLLRMLEPHGWAGSHLGGVGYVSSRPVTQRFDLCDWYRFRKPGRYSLIITSTEVSRVKSPQEGGGLEHLMLASNLVHFQILPADPTWDATQIRNIERELNVARNGGERGEALRRLALLDTPASVRLLVKLYLSNTEAEANWIFDKALQESSHTSIIIPLLKEALSDPVANIPQNLPQLLADLETRRQLGVMPAYPAGPEARRKWTEERKTRARVRDVHLAEANALLERSIDKRAGALRAAAIYQVWWDTTQRTPPGTLAPGLKAELASRVLAVVGDLDHARQVQFAILAWDQMPHERLHALIRKLAQESVHHPPGYDNLEGFRLWCKGWPKECNAAILQDIIKTHAQLDRNIALMMAEGEHPELDSMLEVQLRNRALLENAYKSQRTAAVVLRAGSRNLVPAVDSFLNQLAARGRCEGTAEGELLGYLFRVAPGDGKRRLSTMLEDKKGDCGAQALRTLHQVYPSEDIIPVVTRALNAPSLTVEEMAALYLGDHGLASSEKALWQRLEKLRRDWRGRASELQGQFIGGSDNTRDQTARLEQALASALVRGRNWRLSAPERERLRSGCLTQGCRDVAAGRIYLNL